MYFYIHKINKNEIEQNILLEMCCNACIRFGNGKDIYGLKQKHDFLKGCGASCFRNLFYLH